MADTRGRVAVKLVDPTTNANEAAVSASGHLLVDVANVSDSTITVDTELPAAAALADATATPTVPGVGAFLMGWNGTNWDRVDTANTGRLQVDVVTGGGSNASVMTDNGGFTDNSSSVTAVGYYFDESAGTALTENDIAAARIDSKRAQVLTIEDASTRGQRLAIDASGRASVSLTASSATVTVDTELNTAAALADAASATVSTATVGAVGLVMNATTLDRQRAVVAAMDSTGTGIAAAGLVGQLDDASTATVTENQFAPVRISSRRAVLVEGVASGTNLNVNLAASAATVTVDTELAAAAALTDNFANPTTAPVGAFNMVWDGSTWDRAAGTSADGTLVNLGANNDVTVTSGSITADTELPAAAALADATATPTVPGVGAFLMGWNGTTWDRVDTANTGRLQVDVISGGGAETPTNPVLSYQTSSALAAGSSVALTTAEATSKKLRKVSVWASVPFKATLHTVDNASESAVKCVGGGQALQPWTFDTPHRNYVTLGATAGLDAFRVNVTNLDNTTAADVYATFWYED